MSERDHGAKPGAPPRGDSLQDPLALAAELRRTPVASIPAVPRPEEDDDDAELFAPRPAAPRVPLRERLRAGDGSIELLLFRVAGDLFATDLVAVEEAIELGDVHPVPGAPPAMLGVIGLRGRLVPVYSAERCLGLAARAANAYALVMRAPGAAGEPSAGPRVAVAVQDVEDVHAAALAELRDPGTAGGGAEGDEDAAREAERASAHVRTGLEAVLGVLRWNEELVSLVDSDALLAACAATGEGGREASGRETA